MEPYYQDTHVQLYLGDCRELVPALALERVDLLLSDPPYGVGWDTDYTRVTHPRDAARAASQYWPAVHGDTAPFDPAPWLRYPQVILWGANCYSNRLPMGRWLVWDKRYASGKSFFSSHGEVAWMKGGHGVQIYQQTWIGICRAKAHHTERNRTGERTCLNPAQKPVALARWCIQQARRVQTVLDPFAGSGWVLIASKTLGRRAWGCEIEEAYAETAARRLAATAAGEAAA
jgi:site-specific DNA-methyltransferase (adenine-specific)